MATSLLYQLASPSVLKELREQILQAAEQGKTIMAKERQATIRRRRLKSAAGHQERRTEQKRTLKQASAEVNGPVKKAVSDSKVIQVANKAVVYTWRHRDIFLAARCSNSSNCSCARPLGVCRRGECREVRSRGCGLQTKSDTD